MKLHEQKSNNFFNDVKRQQHEFEVVTDKAGGGPRNLERALDARSKKKIYFYVNLFRNGSFNVKYYR